MELTGSIGQVSTQHYLIICHRFVWRHVRRREKKELLYQMDRIAREVSSFITQVSAGIVETDRIFTIANSNGKYCRGNSVLTRIISTVYAEKGNEKQQEFVDYGSGKGYELLEEVNIEEMMKKTATTAVEKLSAVDFKGGERFG